MHLNYIDQKILTPENLLFKINAWRWENQKIVFTNGCFDILHKGHAKYIAQANDFGTKLIIGVNTDESIQKLKGTSRPINKLEDRLFLLASLRMVHAVIPFGEDTPLELINLIQPDVLIKGGDYDPAETDPSQSKYIVGSDIVKAKGGKVEVINFVDGYSTTNTIEKMKA